MLLSVVIPLYNKNISIKSTITSVLNQNHTHFELIVVNDGSTDGSEEMIKEFKDERVRLITIQNSGVSVARNVGIEASSSDYVCLLDADDYWMPDHLAQIYKLIMLDPNCAMYSSCYSEILENGTSFVPWNKYPQSYLGVLDDFYNAYSRSRSLINSSSVCLNRKLFNKMGGFPAGVKLGEDIYVWLKMAMLGKFAYAGNPQVVIRRNAENRTSTRVNNDILYHIKYFSENEREKQNLSPELQKSLDVFLKKNIFVNALYSLSVRDKKTFNKYLDALKIISVMDYVILRVLGGMFSPRLLKLLAKLRNKIQSA